MKGADVVMAGIVQYNVWLEEEVSGVWGGTTGPQKHVWRLPLAGQSATGLCTHYLCLCNKSPPDLAA